MSDLLESRDIFYPQNFDHLRRKVSFSTPTPVFNTDDGGESDRNGT